MKVSIEKKDWVGMDRVRRVMVGQGRGSKIQVGRCREGKRKGR